jgi:predicted hydrocarbon binding protein
LCHDGAHPNTKKATSDEAAQFMEGMRNYVGKDGIQQSRDETIVYFKYTQNPRGLKVSDGYCLCPILEDAPKGVSPSYCHCSVGYVTAIFEQGLGKPAKVELTNSVLRGGKSCDFTIRFKTV